MTIPPSLPRDPTLSDRYDPRARRFVDMMSGFFNSLTTSGLVVMTGPGEWTISGDTDGLILAGQIFGR